MNKVFSKRIISMLLAISMMIAVLPAAFAEDGGEEVTKYSITLKNATPDGGTVTVSATEAAAGETVTITATPDEGYIVGSVGHWTITEVTKDDGSKTEWLSSVRELAGTPNDDGTYSFTMPASNVGVGAGFQEEADEPLLVDNKISGTNDGDWFLYIANADAYLEENERAGAARIIVDKRYLDVEDITMELEVRQYSTGGYTLIGEETYTGDELSAFFEDAEETKSEHTLSDKSVVEIDTLTKNIRTPLFDDKAFIAGETVYYAIQFSRPSWVNAKGEALYRMELNMMHSPVLAEGSNAREPIVWLYNLDENSHRGSLILSILTGLDIPIGTITNENLNQSIGYLVDWDGYDSVDDPYSTESYDVEYILMGNLSELQMDAFLGGMMENNIRVNLKSTPTAWTAGKTFAELFEIMSDEDAAFQAIFALDDLIYDAEQLDEAEYGQLEGWEDFKEAFDFAMARLTMEGVPEGEEREAEFFWEGYDALLEAYLALTGKTLLENEVELVLAEQDDGTYSITARVEGEDAMDADELSYLWHDKSAAASVSGIAEKDLYKVKVEIKGTKDYYGTVTASLSVPADPEISVSSEKDSVTVSFKAPAAVLNTPAVRKYVAELYREDALIDTAESESAESVTFSGLESKTDYVIKTYLYNAVGRSNIKEQTVTTKSASSDRPSGGGGGLSAGGDKSNAGADSLGSTDTTEDQTDVGRDETSGQGSVAPSDGDETPSVGDADSSLGEGALGDGFIDLGNHAWAADAINTLAEQGIIKGTGANTYSPANNITRADYAILLVRAFDLASDDTTNFADVNASDYFAAELAVARNTGIINGIGDNKYAPRNTINRQDMMVIIYRAMTALGKLDDTTNPVGRMSAPAEYPDYNYVADYAKEAVSYLIASGLVNGKNGRIAPTDYTTRAEVAVLLERILDYVK